MQPSSQQAGSSFDHYVLAAVPAEVGLMNACLIIMGLWCIATHSQDQPCMQLYASAKLNGCVSTTSTASLHIYTYLATEYSPILTPVVEEHESGHDKVDEECGQTGHTWAHGIMHALHHTCR